ncbi:MAG TPA: iron chelate uptake ABC transporter family permease subunit [Planctomycetota bacterium]|nr:iron chelate uptake ABC transporter family permease subunit [Planctomycetota bacterium]
MFGLSYNTFLVLAGSGLLGLTAGVVGAFAVLRRRSLMGDALAHAALPGLCIAFLLYQQRNFFIFLAGATVTGILGVLCVSWLRHNTRIKEDAAIGLVLSVFFGMGIVLSSIIQDLPTGQKAGLDSYLLGQTAGMVMQDLISIIAVSLAALLVLLLFFKEFTILSFDPEYAAVQGWPTFLLDLAMMGLLVITTVIGLPAVGVVLMAALLIIPGVAARFWTDQLKWMLILAALFGLITGIAGTAASATLSDLPAGPVIVLTGTIIFLFSMLFAPRRGILSRGIEHLRLRATIARQNLLRSMYEFTEPALPERRAIAIEELTRARSWSAGQVERLLSREARRSHVEPVAGGWRLTPSGVEAAAQVVRSHRLWETFLIENAEIAPDHVDRDADQIEHILSPDLLHKLEEHLREAGRWPRGAGELPPASAHATPALFPTPAQPESKVADDGGKPL